MKTIENKVSLVPFPFKCQRCKTMMRLRTPHTAVWEGEKETLPDGRGEIWTRIDNITFLCPSCCPIPKEQQS